MARKVKIIIDNGQERVLRSTPGKGNISARDIKRAVEAVASRRESTERSARPKLTNPPAKPSRRVSSAA